MIVYMRIFSLVIYILYIKFKKYYLLFKMMDSIVDSLAELEDNDVENDIMKRDKLLACVASGNSSLYLGKNYTEEQIKKLKREEIEKLFVKYESKLSSLMVKSLGKSIIDAYSSVACHLLKIDKQNELSNDLESDPFLNSALQRFTCDLYYKFGGYLAPVSVGLITGRHYMKNTNEEKISNIYNNCYGRSNSNKTGDSSSYNKESKESRDREKIS